MSSSLDSFSWCWFELPASHVTRLEGAIQLLLARTAGAGKRETWTACVRRDKRPSKGTSFDWVAVEKHNLSYYIGETRLFAI